MEALINQAFTHIDKLADWVHGGNYDLLGPDNEIIMPEYWRETIQPDMQITMMMWPFPEPKEEKDPDPLAPPEGDVNVLDLDAILNAEGGGGGEKKRKKKPASKPGRIGSWMLGGVPGKRTLKDDKKPEVGRHGAGEQSTCTVM